MDPGVYGLSCLNLPTENPSGSDIVSDPSPDAGQILSQFPLLEDDSEGQQINRWSPDIPLSAFNPRVNEESYLVSLRPSAQPTLPQGMGELVGTQTPRHENLINSAHEEDLSDLRPLDPMRCAAAFTCFTEPASSSSTPPIGLVDVNATRDWHQEDVTIHIPSMQSPQYTRTNTATNLLAPSIAPSIPRMPTVALYEDQIVSQGQDQGSQRTAVERQHDVVPSRSLRRPTGIMNRRVPMGRYSCNVCGNRYSQPQGIKRHQREAHEANQCMYCRDFRWGRPYLLRGHLKKRHPEVNTDAALEEAMGMRRRATGIASYRGD